MPVKKEMKNNIKFIDNIKLRDLVSVIKNYNSQGYSCHFQGNGNGTVDLIVEENTVTFG